MSTAAIQSGEARNTAADEVFEGLRKDILSLRLTPGTKLSEVEVAKQLDVSRQPVREAFIRLGNMNLLHIRPQRATVVRRIDDTVIAHARFVRTAIEVEVAQRACIASDIDMAAFRVNLAEQENAALSDDAERFHKLDSEFHRILCAAAGCAFVYETIASTKAHVDRLCMISLRNQREMEGLFEDHTAIFTCLETGDSERIVKLTRQHLSRLDQVIADARLKHPDYFDS